MSDLVTGEAVVLGLRPAKLPSRALAISLDLLLQFVGAVVTIIALAFAAPDLDSAAAAAVSLGIIVFYMVGLPVLIETLSRGRSLGKLAFGLRVVRRDGGPIRFRHALVRGLVAVVEILTFSGVPAVVCSLISPEGRRLGDIFAGTLVVRERVPGAGGGRAALPAVDPRLMHAIGGELVALDLSAVPDSLWLAIRQYLGRIGELDPVVSQGMAQRMVADVVTRTGHAAPYGVHPAAYLGAVLAERQRREWARTFEAHPQQPQYAQYPQLPQQQQQAQPHFQPAPPQPVGVSQPPMPQQPPVAAPQPSAPQPPKAPPTGFAPPA